MGTYRLIGITSKAEAIETAKRMAAERNDVVYVWYHRDGGTYNPARLRDGHVSAETARNWVAFATPDGRVFLPGSLQPE